MPVPDNPELRKTGENSEAEPVSPEAYQYAGRYVALQYSAYIGYVLHQFAYFYIGISDVSNNAINYFAQVVWSHVGSHTYCNS